jgi:hypothetical protein
VCKGYRIDIEKHYLLFFISVSQNCIQNTFVFRREIDGMGKSKSRKKAIQCSEMFFFFLLRVRQENKRIFFLNSNVKKMFFGQEEEEIN